MTTIALENETNERPMTPAEERAAWLASRRLGIGGSDAAAALGLSPYTTPYELYLDKRGEAPDQDLSGNKFVEWGSRLEDVVADAYAEKTGQKVHRVNHILKHPEHPFIIANLDRRIVGAKRGLEVKTASAWAQKDEEAWGETGTDQVPGHYLVQCTHYMAVTGYEAFDLAVLMGGSEFRIYTIHRNEELIAQLIEREAAFWKCVQDGTPPPSITMGDVRRKFGNHIAETSVDADEYISEVVEEYLALKQKIKVAGEMDKQAEALQVILGDYMGENEVLNVHGAPKLSFKGQSTGKRLPATFKDAEPAIFEQYAVEGRTRVMRILAEKKGKK